MEPDVLHITSFFLVFLTGRKKHQTVKTALMVFRVLAKDMGFEKD
jgi:hypothetical protein